MPELSARARSRRMSRQDLSSNGQLLQSNWYFVLQNSAHTDRVCCPWLRSEAKNLQKDFYS